MGFYIGCGMVLAQGDNFVLVKESRVSAKHGLYNLPGGSLELDEDLLACVKREVQEETGVEVEPETFLGLDQTVLADGHNVLFFIFSGRVKKGAVFKADDQAMIQTFSWEQIVDMDVKGQLRAPNVLTSIKRYREGVSYPLSVLQAHHLSSLPAIVVDKD